MKTDTLRIFTDGGARGNPGPAGAGIVIFNNNGELLKIEGNYLGVKTNNQAEYEALIIALKVAKRISNSKIECYLDSELAVKQLNGEYKVKNDTIRVLKGKVDELVGEYEHVSFFHITREKNAFADKLVNIVLDAQEQS